MHSISWWPMFALVVTATVMDIHSRRIPNWLVLPFLAGGVAVNTAYHGAKGLGQSIGSIALTVAVTGIFCWLRGMNRRRVDRSRATRHGAGAINTIVSFLAT